MARKEDQQYDTLHRITQHPTAYSVLAPATKLPSNVVIQVSCCRCESDKPEKQPVPAPSYRSWTPTEKERKVVKGARILPLPRVTTLADKGYSLNPSEVIYPNQVMLGNY